MAKPGSLIRRGSGGANLLVLYFRKPISLPGSLEIEICGVCFLRSLEPTGAPGSRGNWERGAAAERVGFHTPHYCPGSEKKHRSSTVTVIVIGIIRHHKAFHPRNVSLYLLLLTDFLLLLASCSC